MKAQFIVIIGLMSLISLSSYSQSRRPAVENEIIIETETGTQTKEFLEVAQAQTPSMSAITLITLFTFLSAPFGIYLIVQKQSTNKRKSELQSNVVLMSEYQKSRKQKNQSKENTDSESEEKKVA